ncbi:MAG: hypothetical protein OXT49_03860 [Gammaproteobacteria bacterium]|nr:hypothetical protein [Gammaproteobacteria bacterium]
MQAPEYSHWMKASLYRANSVLVGAEALMQLSSIFMAFMLSLYTPLANHLMWWGVLSVTSVGYYLVLRRRLKAPDAGWPLQRWYREYLCYRFFIGCLWIWPLVSLYLEPNSRSLFVIVGSIYALVVLVLALINLINGSLLATALPMAIAVFVLAAVLKSIELALLGAVLVVMGLVLIRFSLFVREIVKRYIRLDYQREIARLELRDKTHSEKLLAKTL